MTGSSYATAGLIPRPKNRLRLASFSRVTLSARGWNVVSAVFLFTARAIASIAQLKYIEQNFGGSYSGLTVVSNQILFYITLLELGLAQAAVSFLYEPIRRRDHETTSALVIALRFGMRRLILFGSLAIFPALVIYARFLHSRVPYATIVVALCLVAMSAFGQLASVHFQAYLNAGERLRWVNLILGAGYLIKTAIGLALALHSHEYLWLPLTISVLTVLEFLGLKLAFARQFPEFRPTEWQWAAVTIRQRARFALIHKIAGVAYYQSDFIILSLTAGLLVVKDYAKYQYVSAALFSVIGTVSIALTSSFAHGQLSRPSEARFGEYARLQFGAALLGVAALLGYFYVAPVAVRWAFGQVEIIGPWPLALFGAALFLNIVKIADDMMITARGAFRAGYGIPIVEVPIYITLGVLLSRRFGFCGILVASIATNLLISVLVKGFLLSRQVFDATRLQWFARRSLNVGKALLLSSPLILLHWLTARTFSAPALQVASWCGGTFLYGFVVFRILALRSTGAAAFIPSAEAES
jgi:hypothetical protein